MHLKCEGLLISPIPGAINNYSAPRSSTICCSASEVMNCSMASEEGPTVRGSLVNVNISIVIFNFVLVRPSTCNATQQVSC